MSNKEKANLSVVQETTAESQNGAVSTTKLLPIKMEDHLQQKGKLIIYLGR